MSLDTNNDDEIDNDDDLLADDQPMLERRVTGRQAPINVVSPFRGPAITILVAALSSLVTAAVVKSCGACVTLGTWSPPYQAADVAAVEKKANADEHAAIRTEVKNGLESIHLEIQSSQREIIKAVTAKQKDDERRRPR